MLDDLTQVIQGLQSRTYLYDSLGRLKTATTPESGAVNYTYNDSGTTATRTDARGVITNYSYDGLNRLYQLTYTTTGTTAVSTPSVTFTYGTSPASYNNGRVSSMSDSVGGESYGYDQLGRMISLTKTIGATNYPLAYAYNLASELTSITYPSGRVVAQSFDNIGRLSQITSSSVNYLTVASSNGYNAAHEVLSATYGNGVAATFTYNARLQFATLAYPSGSTITYTPNAAGRMVSAVDTANGINYATNASYAPTAALSSLTNGASLISTFYYNNRLQPCRISVKSTGTAPASCADAVNTGDVLDFQYDFALGVADNGNVNRVTNRINPGRSITYTYDELNRIKSAVTDATSGQYCWGQLFGSMVGGNYVSGYDPWANLKTITPDPSRPGCPVNTLAKAINAYNKVVDTGYGYDNAGNMTADASYSYGYNAENQLTSAAGVTYIYDGDGRRVQKSSGKLYWYATGTDPLDETDLAGNTNNASFNEYIFFGGKRIARRDYSNNVFYYFSDHLGTSREIVQDGQTTPCYDADFYPFGGEAVLATNTCSQNCKFTGKERDSESGLDNFGARYFGSSMGRFMSPDAFYKDSHVGDPQSWNEYAYVRNNPLRYTDPNGETATVSSDCTTDQQNHTTCNVTVSASIAIYSANGANLTQDQLNAAASTIQSSIQDAWSGSFTQDGVTYNVSTQISVSVAGSESDAMKSGAQNVIGLSNGPADPGNNANSYVNPRLLSPLAGIAGKDTGVWNINTVGQDSAHEFTHLLGVSDKPGAVLSNTNILNDPTIPHTATSSDFRWGIREAINSVNLGRNMSSWGCHAWQCASVTAPATPHIYSTNTVGAPWLWWK